MAKKNGFLFLETSALDNHNENVEKAYLMLLKEITEKVDEAKSPMSRKRVMAEVETQKKKGCW